MTRDEYMAEALDQARKAGELGEVPIGAVIVLGDRIIGRGHNEVETRGMVTAHAEIIALEQAARTVGDWRLDGAAVYATVEPCHMCLGALHLAR
ncbi:MAG TPA: nucleoside deaminase, partial [Candidatus Krumholzibacterium sp.]|nr:nucleoside deaminase [Candidatus Krumholzibacterium sp.]